MYADIEKIFLETVYKYRKEYPNWRYGQVLFNALYEVDPDLANEIRGTEIDPFYYGIDEVTFTPFFEKIANNWYKTE
jgi:hypothetical protein